MMVQFTVEADHPRLNIVQMEVAVSTDELDEYAQDDEWEFVKGKVKGALPDLENVRVVDEAI